LHRPPAPPRWRFPFIRITVDTAQDLERARAIYTLLDGATPTGEHVITAYLKLERSA